MGYTYDMIVIGLGPAGMAVSAMASEMGLNVCAVEKNRIGGECMNVGCIPSKSLLRIANYRSSPAKLHKMGLADLPKPDINQPFNRIQQYLKFIRDKKTIKMFDKVHLVYQKGPAVFVDPHTVKVADTTYSARRIFICIGTRADVPEFDGIDRVDCLTNHGRFWQ